MYKKFKKKTKKLRKKKRKIGFKKLYIKAKLTLEYCSFFFSLIEMAHSL